MRSLIRELRTIRPDDVLGFIGALMICFSAIGFLSLHSRGLL